MTQAGEDGAGSRCSVPFHACQIFPGVSTEMRGLQPCDRRVYDPNLWRGGRFWVLCPMSCHAWQISPGQSTDVPGLQIKWSR